MFEDVKGNLSEAGMYDEVKVSLVLSEIFVGTQKQFDKIERKEKR